MRVCSRQCCHLTQRTEEALYRAFYEYVDMLLDENELLGPGQNCQAELRPLALSMLAELVHHLRNDLKLQQLVRIVSLFSRFVIALRAQFHTTAEACKPAHLQP